MSLMARGDEPLDMVLLMDPSPSKPPFCEGEITLPVLDKYASLMRRTMAVLPASKLPRHSSAGTSSMLYKRELRHSIGEDTKF